ncbi:MAG: 50S ribosomal protein L10 [bacterium]
MNRATKPKHKQAIANKTGVVENLTRDLQEASIAILTDYRGKGGGLTVKDFKDLRKKLREQKGRFQVVKNTLACRALKKAGISELDSYFIKPTAITFGFDDPVGVAKVVVDFARERKGPINDEGLPAIKVAYMDGVILDVARVRALAALPSKQVILGQVLGTLQAPIRGLMNVLNGTLVNMVNVLNEIKKMKESATEPAAESAA